MEWHNSFATELETGERELPELNEPEYDEYDSDAEYQG